ncbi:MAG: DUF1385 domain-containing protein [Ignavibacteriae bacterium]|nr:DUF1385 domain-containing protein [Ignavibacteriota bacterium]
MQNQEEIKTEADRSLYNYDPNNPLVVGGQAVIEGVMMRAPGRIATAVRRSNGDIVVKSQEHKSLGERYPVFKLPILRGAVGLIEMLFVGIETLNFSAEVAMQDADAEEQSKKNGKAKKKEPASKLKLALTVLFSLAVGIGIFFVGPLFITTKLFDVEQEAFWFNITAGAIRITILIAYMSAIALMKDVKRLFQYHGAEHKLVFTFEQKAPLTSESAVRYTRFHPRCGTSFVLIVMLVAILLFAVLDTLLIMWLGKMTLLVRILTHLPLIPLVGGVSYEFIRWSAKRSETTFGKFLVAPGLWMQRITTNEPDASQLEVAAVAIKCALGMDVGQQVTYVQHANELVAANS